MRRPIKIYDRTFSDIEIGLGCDVISATEEIQKLYQTICLLKPSAIELPRPFLPIIETNSAAFSSPCLSYPADILCDFDPSCIAPKYQMINVDLSRTDLSFMDRAEIFRAIEKSITKSQEFIGRIQFSVPIDNSLDRIFIKQGIGLAWECGAERVVFVITEGRRISADQFHEFLNVIRRFLGKNVQLGIRCGEEKFVLAGIEKGIDQIEATWFHNGGNKTGVHWDELARIFGSAHEVTCTPAAHEIKRILTVLDKNTPMGEPRPIDLPRYMEESRNSALSFALL